MLLAAEVGIYVPIILVLFAVFLYFVLRRRAPRRTTERMDSGEGQRLDF